MPEILETELPGIGRRFTLPLELPIRVAEDASVLDIMSGGRLEVGVAPGGNLTMYTAFGLDSDKRHALMAHHLDLMRDAWTGRPLPKVRRIVWRMVPSAGNRRALLERGDADVSFDLPPRDVAEMANDRKLTVVGSLIERREGPELTPRQREVLQLLAEGRSMKEVGTILNVAPRTVAFHKYKMMEQLRLKTSAELVQFAVKQGVV